MTNRPRIAVPPGTHDVYALTGDNSAQSGDTVIFVDGARVAETVPGAARRSLSASRHRER